MKRVWARLDVRTRIALSAAIPLAAALVIGTVAVALVFAHGRVSQLDRETRIESDVLRGLVTNGQLPRPLPLPLSSSLLAQVLNGHGDVLSASPSASTVQALTQRRSTGVTTDERGGYAGAPLRIRTTAVTVGSEHFVLVVAAPLGDVRRALHALKTVLLLVVPVLLLLTATLLWWVTGLALRPVGVVLAKQRAFVTDAAHELRSPIASLVVQLDVAADRPSDVHLPELLSDLRADVERLARLTDDLLLLARLGDVPLPDEVVDVRQLLGVEGPVAPVRGDAASLRRLVDNLTGNAHRYSSQVEVSVTDLPDVVRVDVDDDGPGIPVADRERVFDRWVRLDESRARAKGGSGLGLALAREIARSHGGDVVVQDSPLGGARLSVTLPRA